jgi:diaminopimelate epimerase
MTHLTFTKHHGLGNDFLCAVEPGVPFSPADVVRWCDRRRGVGADGVITAERDTTGTADWAMVLHNADGTRAEISGNGIRCLGQAVLAHEGRVPPAELSVRTDAGVRDLTVAPTDDPATVLVRVQMGSAKAGPAPSDRLAGLGVTAHHQLGVDLGNPHLVVLVDDPAVHDLGVVGPAVEAAYPEGLNVHLVAVTARDRIVMAVWERGAGLTEACGSGACAAAWAAHRWGLVDETVTVEMPGGAATIEVGDPLVLIGPATHVATVIVDV